MEIIVFTDPQCPFAYSAEPIQWRLKWLYGDQIQWRNSMIVLSGYQDEVPAITAEQAAEYQAGVRATWGMPMDISLRPRQAHTITAATAVVAAQIYAPEKADALLRKLRITTFKGNLLDELPVIIGAAKDANIEFDPAWLQEQRVVDEVAKQAESARAPRVGSALAHKLSQTTTGRTRYSAPSYRISDFELPGMWPLEAYDAVIANALPDAIRRSNPKSVIEILEWAGTPLATAEVAKVYGKDIETTRTELAQVASMDVVGQDGFWAST